MFKGLYYVKRKRHNLRSFILINNTNVAFNDDLKKGNDSYDSDSLGLDANDAI